jgi:hypothetical protein
VAAAREGEEIRLPQENGLTSGQAQPATFPR